jgi:hypothetical protein
LCLRELLLYLSILFSFYEIDFDMVLVASGILFGDTGLDFM